MSDNTHRIVAVLQRELVVPPEPARAEAHIEAMLLEFEFALAQSRNADVPAALPVKGQRRVLAGAMVAGLLTLTSGLAVAGALPPPVQHLVSRAGQVVGIELPDPHSGAPAPRIDHRAPAVAPRRGPAEPRIDVPRAQSGAPPSLGVAGDLPSPARPSGSAPAFAVGAAPPATSATKGEAITSAPGAPGDQPKPPRDPKGPAAGNVHPKHVKGPKPPKQSKPPKHSKPVKPTKPTKPITAKPADSGAQGTGTPRPGKSGSAPGQTRQG